MTTPEDLVWWLRIAPSLTWTWAKTYADSAPHAYVVLGKTDGFSRDDFVRTARGIHTFGEPGRFYSSTNTYLTLGRWRWWTMDERLEDTDLINRAVNDRVYGVQDAPRTFSAAFTEHDGLATTYDQEHPRDAERDEEVLRRVIQHFGTHRPTTLDIGSGTGAALDLGLTVPERYTGVDPSQAMLNALVRKHPGVARLIPARFEDVHSALLSPSYELVIALDVPDLSDRDAERMHLLASDLSLIA